MSEPRVALATSRELPEWEQDDAGLARALASRGVQAEWCVWNDPGVDWAGFDAVLVRTTWDYCDHLDAFQAWLARLPAVTRLLGSAEVLLWNLDKRYLRDLADGGVSIPDTLWVEPGQDAEDALCAKGWKRAFAKPVVGATARATLRFSTDREGLDALAAHRAAFHEPMMLQPYLASVEEQGEVSVILIDGEITHAVRKIPAAGDYRVQDDWGGIDQPLGLFHGEDDFARRVTRVLQARFDGELGRHPPLVARVDLLRDDREALVLNELELVEPSLFFRHGPGALEALAQAVATRV